MLEDNPLFQPNHLEPSLDEVNYLFKDFVNLGFNPIQVKIAKLNAIATTIPRLAAAAEESKKLLLSQLEFEP